MAEKENLCEKVHKIFNKLKRFSYPFDEKEIPENGIYVFFEKGEKYKDMDKIVRIGTHTGQGNLPKRLKEHLVTENKDRSVFRKNIGRAILNKAKDPFLEQWNIDLTTRENRAKYASSIDDEKQKQVEEQVSSYMRKNFSFSVIPVKTKAEREKYEAFLISVVSNCKECKSSAKWLGNFSPEQKIRESGLWLKQGLFKEIPKGTSLENLKKFIEK